MSRRSILADVSRAYVESAQRYQQYADRGDFDRADIYLSEMQLMERDVHVQETSIEWRRVIAERKAREQKAARR